MKMTCHEIEKWVRENPEEFSSLVTRFEQLDDTLTDEEVARAYVGIAYSAGYDDMGFDRIMLDTLVKQDEEAALRLAWEMSCRKPFNLDALDVLLKIVPQEHVIWRLAAWRFSRLLKAIMSTGDGASQSTAFNVTSVNDEYMVMKSAFEINAVGERELQVNGMQSYDCYQVAPTNLFPHDKIYFEITSFNIEAP